MTLSLLSGIPKEVNWALSRLVNLSDEHNARFVLATVPKLTNAIFYALEAYLRTYAAAKESFAPFSAPYRLELLRKQATESLLVLRNASHNELNVTHLVHDPNTMKVVNGVLRLPLHEECNGEMIIYALDFLQVIGHHLPVSSKGKHPYGDIPIDSLESILSTSMDRAILVPSLNVLTVLMTPPNTLAANADLPYSPPYAPSPDSPAVRRVLQFLAVVQDHVLLTASLEFLAAYLTSLQSTQALLLDTKLTHALRLLVSVLRYEQITEVHAVTLGPPIRTAEREDEWLPYELTEEELARIAPMPEPERSFQWYVFTPVKGR